MAATTSAQATDIEFWYGNTGDVADAIDNACNTFNDSQTRHTVTCISQGGYEVAMQKAIAAVRSKKHPALIQFFDAGTLDLLLSGAVVPIEEVLPDVDWQGYINGARSYYQASDGRLFSQPYNASTLIFYTNRNQLAKVGVTNLPGTWEEIIDVARKLKDSGHACPFTSDFHPWRVLEQFSARHGLALASQDNGYGGLDTEYLLNQGLIAQHLTNFANWRSEGLVRLNQDTKAGHYQRAFNGGECAMMEASTGSYGAAFKALGDAVVLGLAPMYEGHTRYNTLIGGGSIWIMKGHGDDKIEASRAFLDFLREPETQIVFTKATGYVPVTKDALAYLVQSGRSKQLEFATSELGIESMNKPGTGGSRGIRLGFFVQFRDIFKEETERAFNGEQSMPEALDHAKRRGDELLRRFEQTYQGVKLP